MQQGLKGSIAGVVAAATLLAGGILTVPHAMALEADGQYYSSKQPYVAPSEATTASYSQAPEGYETVYTESMARHGSRGLSSYKYDALLMNIALIKSELRCRSSCPLPPSQGIGPLFQFQ